MPGSVAISAHRKPTEAEKAAAKAKQVRDTKSADRLIDLKNGALADLENGQFARADPNLLNLATAGAREPLGRDWTIERLLAIGTIDLKGNPSAYEEAVDRARNGPQPGNGARAQVAHAPLPGRQTRPSAGLSPSCGSSSSM